MTVISLRDYAKSKNVSYEAIRKQVTRYKAELAGHIIMDGRQQFLDEEAVAFLDARRQKNPVVLYHQEKDDIIRALEKNEKVLLAKLADQGEQLVKLMDYKMKAENDKRALEDAKTAQERRERELQDREAEMDQAIEAVRQEASEAAQKAAEEKAAKELDLVKEAHQAALDARDKKIQELENRNLWQILRDRLRKKEG